MNDTQLKQMVIEAVKHFSEIADGYIHGFEVPEVEFFEDQLTAGWAHWTEYKVRFNLAYLRDPASRYDMLHQIVPHEVAHIAHKRARETGLFSSRVRYRPHGRQWKTIMRDWFDRDPERCHNYGEAGQNIKRQRRFSAACACQKHELTTTRVNRMKRGVVYRCGNCKTTLKLETKA